MLLALAAACSNGGAAGPDAGVAIDAGPDAPAVETCTNCTQIPLAAELADAVEGDGSNIYVVVRPGPDSAAAALGTAG